MRDYRAALAAVSAFLPSRWGCCEKCREADIDVMGLSVRSDRWRYTEWCAPPAAARTPIHRPRPPPSPATRHPPLPSLPAATSPAAPPRVAPPPLPHRAVTLCDRAATLCDRAATLRHQVPLGEEAGATSVAPTTAGRRAAPLHRRKLKRPALVEPELGACTSSGACLTALGGSTLPGVVGEP